jgi:hypothetical protein
MNITLKVIFGRIYSFVICGLWLDWWTRKDSMWHDLVRGDFRARLRLEVRSADAWLGADGRSENI